MSITLSEPRIVQAKPFLKWAGGKSQLLSQLRPHYPPELKDGRIVRYVEPFLGGGAVFLDVAQSFDIHEAFLIDINEELILVYTVVQRDPARLIEALTDLRDHYFSLDAEPRADYFYEVRERYNTQKQAIDFTTYSDAWIERAAFMIFLNKTCFNGLFRVNASGLFNVPFGRYKRPIVFEEQNIFRISQLLRKATLTIGSYDVCEQWIDDDTFVYFDPPYRPISATSSFTSYSRDKFNDEDQRALATFYARLDAYTQAKLMLSNSDPRNLDPDDDFFDSLYKQFIIRRVSANRMINSDARGRGKIDELLITNY